ncbi:MAG TPA: hypothetical protein VF193_07270 [Steroidobacter sp.]|jgi:hypothetical protein
MEERPWADQLRDLIGAAERASAAVRYIRAWVWENVVAGDVVPRVMPEPLESHLTGLEHDLGGIGELARALFGRLSSDPSGKLLAGWPLSREEYYLVRALGVDFGGARELGLTDLADYEVYRMLCYEDDDQWSYINVHLRPREREPRRIGARFGRPPEECRRRALRSEQVTFFRDRLPEIYKRFSDD